MIRLLADTAAGADAMISGDWVLKLIGAFFTGCALLAGRYWGKKEASGMRLEDPVPEVPTRKVITPPSYHQFQALDQRVTVLERDHRELRNDLAKQFQHVLEAGAERQERILEKIDDVARAWHARMDALQLNRK